MKILSCNSSCDSLQKLEKFEHYEDNSSHPKILRYYGTKQHNNIRLVLKGNYCKMATIYLNKAFLLKFYLFIYLQLQYNLDSSKLVDKITVIFGVFISEALILIT